MTTPLRISIPHQLGRAEARRRIATGFSKLATQLPGGANVCSQRTIDIELPGLLGGIAGAFKDRLQKAGQLLLTKG